jgi:hypothetical protein
MNIIELLVSRNDECLPQGKVLKDKVANNTLFYANYYKYIDKHMRAISKLGKKSHMEAILNKIDPFIFFMFQNGDSDMLAELTQTIFVKIKWMVEKYEFVGENALDVCNSFVSAVGDRCVDRSWVNKILLYNEDIDTVIALPETGDDFGETYMEQIEDYLGNISDKISLKNKASILVQLDNLRKKGHSESQI